MYLVKYRDTHNPDTHGEHISSSEPGQNGIFFLFHELHINWNQDDGHQEQIHI